MQWLVVGGVVLSVWLGSNKLKSELIPLFELFSVVAALERFVVVVLGGLSVSVMDVSRQHDQTGS